MIALTKQMPLHYDYAGEGVGFLKVGHADTGHVVASLKPHVERDAWSMEYEDALRGFFQQVRVGHEKIGGLPWTEIDTADDYDDAARRVFPAIQGDPEAVWAWESAAGQAPAVRRGA